MEDLSNNLLKALDLDPVCKEANFIRVDDLPPGAPTPFVRIPSENVQRIPDLAKLYYPMSAVAERLLPTPNYFDPGPSSSAGSLRTVDDDEPGITHCVDQWVFKKSKSGHIDFAREELKSTVDGRRLQLRLLEELRRDSKLPADKYSVKLAAEPGPGVAQSERHQLKTMFVSMANSERQVGAATMKFLKTAAEEYEKHLPDLLASIGRSDLQRPGSRLWSDIVKEADAASPDVRLIGEGFGATRPEAFIKSGVSYTAEHYEHLGSSSINIYPLQTPPELRPKPGQIKNANEWRGWLLSDIMKVHGFNRRQLHDYYTEELDGDDMALVRWLVRTVPTYRTTQYEGDVIVTTHLGSHDVSYCGRPSFQVQ